MIRIIGALLGMTSWIAFAQAIDETSPVKKRDVLALKANGADPLFDVRQNLPKWSGELKTGGKVRHNVELGAICDVHLDLA